MDGADDEDGHVFCYSGGRYGERPQRFRWRGKEYEVAAVERQWLRAGRKAASGVARCFWVRTTTGEAFALEYLEGVDRWSIRMRTTSGQPGSGC